MARRASFFDEVTGRKILSDIKWLLKNVRTLLALPRGAARRSAGVSQVGVVVGGTITEVSEGAGPPSTHQYKAKSIAGREITVFTTPDNARDDDVLYLAAAEDAPCRMYWDADSVGHIIATTEIFDTILDA